MQWYNKENLQAKNSQSELKMANMFSTNLHHYHFPVCEWQSQKAGVSLKDIILQPWYVETMAMTLPTMLLSADFT